MALVGYIRRSTRRVTSESCEQQRALIEAGVPIDNLYVDIASCRQDPRRGLAYAIDSLAPGDALLVDRLDRLALDLESLLRTIADVLDRRSELRPLSGDLAALDTNHLAAPWIRALTDASRRWRAERSELARSVARRRGRLGGSTFKLSIDQIRYAQRELRSPSVHIGKLCEELKCSRSTLYRYVDRRGALRSHGQRVADQHGSSELR